MIQLLTDIKDSYGDIKVVDGFCHDPVHISIGQNINDEQIVTIS